MGEGILISQEDEKLIKDALSVLTSNEERYYFLLADKYSKWHFTVSKDYDYLEYNRQLRERISQILHLSVSFVTVILSGDYLSMPLYVTKEGEGVYITTFQR